MRLEDYWGVGPKTAATLREALGEEAAVAAIESADSRALVEAGLSRGRATRILRRAQGGEGLDVLGTRDARAVYRDVLSLAEEYAVTRRAADRVRVLTPLATHEAREERLAAVTDATAAWRALDEGERSAVVETFATHDSRASGDRPDVETALALVDLALDTELFADVEALSRESLGAAAEALAALEGDRVSEGVDEELDAVREDLGTLEDMAAAPAEVLETVGADVRDAREFRAAVADHVTARTDLGLSRVEDAMPREALDAERFVTDTLRALADDLRTAADERERTVRADLESTLEDERETVEAAVAAVSEAAFLVSLARFAVAFDLSPPDLVDEEVLAVEGARNLGLVDAGEAVQPVTYAVGDHAFGAGDGAGEGDGTGEVTPPSGDRVAVLTGANSGGKTTLLETLCQVALLARMGLPVPAERAAVGPVDTVVFHRRHASFNAGVLESTLRSVVPPLTGGGRTLMLVDEFEAITEPGSAADLLHGLVTLTVERDALGVFVTHLAEDLEPLPEAARTDGIFAEGLTGDLDLEVDYQPRFGTLGRSTPEFIVSRLVAEARDRGERAGYEALAAAVGEEAVQRTLADARWSREDGGDAATE